MTEYNLNLYNGNNNNNCYLFKLQLDKILNNLKPSNKEETEEKKEETIRGEVLIMLLYNINNNKPTTKSTIHKATPTTSIL